MGKKKENDDSQKEVKNTEAEKNQDVKVESNQEKPKADTKKEEAKKADSKKTENKKEKAKKEKKSKEKAPKKKSKLKRFFLILILVAVVAVLVYLFAIPMTSDFTKLDDTKTKNGILDTSIEVKSNKPIVNIYYGIDVKNQDDKNEYELLNTKGFLFSKKVNLYEISIPVGKSNIYLYIESLTQHEIIKIPVTFELGYIGELNEDDIIDLNDFTQIVSNELLISFKDSVSEKKAKDLIEEYDGEIVGEIYFLNQYQVKFNNISKTELANKMEKLEEEKGVELVSYNYVSDFDESNDNKVSKESTTNWSKDLLGHFAYLRRMNIVGAWNLIEESDKVQSRINVGVIDSFLDNQHEDLSIDSKNIIYLATEAFEDYDDLYEYYENHVHNHTLSDYVSQVWNEGNMPNCVYNSEKNHGTNVTGIIAAQDNGYGTYGINSNSNIYFSPAWRYNQVEETSGENDGGLKKMCSIEDMVYRISYMAMSDCRVINMSIGGDKISDDDLEDRKKEAKVYERAFKKLEENGKDFLIVKSAGNDDMNAAKEYMNSMFSLSEKVREHVIIVGAINGINTYRSDGSIIESRAEYSNYGKEVDVYATGKVYNTYFGNEYDFMQGTSQATPIVTGIVSLIYSVNPDLNYKQVKEIVLNTADGKVGYLGQIGNIVNAEAAIKEALNYTGNIEAIQTPAKYGFLQGKVIDASTGNPIYDAMEIKLIDKSDESKVYYADIHYQSGTITRDDVDYENTSISYGNYDLFLPIGHYKMEINVQSYLPEVIDNIEITEGIITYNASLEVIEEELENLNGVVTGHIINAFDGSDVPNANLVVYKGVNVTNEDVVATTTSDEYGKYSLELEPGNYTVHVSIEGYINGKSTVVSLNDYTRTNQDITITPKLNEGEVRIVLTWGLTPSDLDSHLIGPTPEGDQFHTAFWNKNYYYENTQYDNLDLDDTTSYGPETTSVYVGVDGTYTFYVHDYTNRNSSNSSALENSNAVVTIYIAGKDEPIVYNVPSGEGTVWKVCEIKDGEVTPINEMSYDDDVVSNGRPGIYY